MNKINHNKGDVYGRLTLTGKVEMRLMGNKGNKTTYVEAQCECGVVKWYGSSKLRSGHTKSCGCLRSDVTSSKSVRHGDARTRLYKIFIGMKSRCTNLRNDRYFSYGGRGITVCAEWSENFESFRNWAISHGYKDALTLDRIDNNGNYEPNNCRWATRVEQARNTRTNVIFNGECASEASRRLGGQDGLVSGRIKKGWTIESAFTVSNRGVDLGLI